MDNFLQRAFMGRPLDKVLKALAIVDGVAGVLGLLLKLFFIRILYDYVVEELEDVSTNLKGIASEHQNKDIARAHDHVLSQMAVNSCFYVIVPCVDAICEIYLCVILWAASKDGSDIKLKRWWWIRLCVTLFMTCFRIGRVVAEGLEWTDIFFVVIFIYRMAELVVVRGFRKQMA